ncbi:unnamed protein product, partial [marine sediment metagenome]
MKFGTKSVIQSDPSKLKSTVTQAEKDRIVEQSDHSKLKG